MPTQESDSIQNQTSPTSSPMRETETFVPQHSVTPFPKGWKVGQAHEKQINAAVDALLKAVAEIQEYLKRNT